MSSVLVSVVYFSSVCSGVLESVHGVPSVVVLVVSLVF